MLSDNVRHAAPSTDVSAAQEQWSALAPLLAGRPRVRLSRDRKSYFHKWERPLTTTLPAQPAAVPIYSNDATTRVLVVDLDRARGGRDQVLTDSVRVAALVERCGGRVIIDESPSGGRHLYIPLAEPIDFCAARDFALDLAACTPSMDPSPHQGVPNGLIRPPGSVHRSGGHQRLVGDLRVAVRVATVRNGPKVWTRLRDAVEQHPRRVDAIAAEEPMDTASVNAKAGQARSLSAYYLAIATTGLYNTARYRSPSEARGAVILAAANAGLTLRDVLARLADGRWRGLAALYAAKYRPGDRARAVRLDWTNAAKTIAKSPPQRPGSDPVQKSPTSEPATRGVPPTAPGISGRSSPDEYRFLRSWFAVLRMSADRWPGRSGLARRFVLRAIGEAAMKSGSRYVAFGTRSLSIAVGVDHTTTAAHLRALRAEADPFIDLIEDKRGLAGDLYQLRIPAGLAGRADRAAWPAGRMHALRPAFRELGLPAAAIYEALETAKGPASSFELAKTAGIGRSTAYEALEILAAWNLARPDSRGRWRIVASTCLGRLAERWGVLEAIRARITRHRAERAAYRRALQIPDDPWADVALATWTADNAENAPPPDPPADPLDTALDLLQREMGAFVTVT